LILSDDIVFYGTAVMAKREGLAFEGTIESDCAAVAARVLDLIEAGITVHCLRDLTRGGRASALVEIAETAGFAIALTETNKQSRSARRSPLPANCPGSTRCTSPMRAALLPLWPPRTPTGPWHCCDGSWWRMPSP
jgi:AIR synthase related protein, C-terminal domain